MAGAKTDPTTKERVLAVAAGLLEDGGREALSTRAVAAAAGIQAPTLYRLFGDKQGLLDAVAERGFARYLADKRDAAATDDPVEALRAGWDAHVEFGLSRPAYYLLVYAEPRPTHSSAAEVATEILRGLVESVAAAGRLRLSVERAVAIIEAAGTGVVLKLLSTPPAERDPELSAVMREAILSSISDYPPAVNGPDAGIAVTAVTLAQALRENGSGAALTPPELALMLQWLDRMSDVSAEPGRDVSTD